MLVIVGLGNWEAKYQDTRHNIGFLVLDRLVLSAFPEKGWQKNARTNCLVIKTDRFLLAKPQTSMNLSGQEIKKLIDFYKIDSRNLLIVHDDLDLELGEIKISKNQGSAGHRGVRSVIKVLGIKDFWRARIGIGRPKENQNKEQIVNFVLNKFFKDEEKALARTLEEATDLLLLAIEKGIETVRGKKSVLNISNSK